MKKLIFALFIACFFSFSGFSQGYEPMLREGAQWVVQEGDINQPNSYRKLTLLLQKKDTLILGQEYQEIFGYESEYNPVFPFQPLFYFDTSQTPLFKQYVREDTFNRKVFKIDSLDKPETLIFDFNLEVGDTFNCYQAPNQPDNISVTAIDFGDYIGDFKIRKRWAFDQGGVYWLEGIGNINAFLEPCMPSAVSVSTHYCLSGVNCNWTLFGTSSVSYENLNMNHLDIIPNPFSSHAAALMVGKPNISSITFASIDGRIETPSYTYNDTELRINTENLPNGVYIITIKTKDGKQYRAKGVKY